MSDVLEISRLTKPELMEVLLELLNVNPTPEQIRDRRRIELRARAVAGDKQYASALRDRIVAAKSYEQCKEFREAAFSWDRASKIALININLPEIAMETARKAMGMYVLLKDTENYDFASWRYENAKARAENRASRH